MHMSGPTRTLSFLKKFSVLMAASSSIRGMPEGSYSVQGFDVDTPSRIQAVVIHFSPLVTGQPLCWVYLGAGWTISPEG